MRLSRRKIAKLYKTTNQSRRATKDIGSGKRKTGGNRSRRATALNLRRRTMKGRRMKGGEEVGGEEVGGEDEVEGGVDEVEAVEEGGERGEDEGEDEGEEGVDEVEAAAKAAAKEAEEEAEEEADEAVDEAAAKAVDEATFGEHDDRNDNSENEVAPIEKGEEPHTEDEEPIEEPPSDETPTSILGDGVRKLDFEEIINRVKILTADPGSPAVLMTDPEDYAQFITGIVNIAIQVVDDRINEKIDTAIDTRLADNGPK